MEGEKYLLIVGGPTASGKTEVALRLALHYRTEILSADSRQFYRELSIGTAKPPPEILEQVPHHFINSLSIRDTYSVGDFEREALALLGELYARHEVVILAGGSGLYIQALCRGLDKFPEVPENIRDKWTKTLREKGLETLQQALLRSDPEYYQEVDLRNPARLIRALSVIDVSGKPFSSFRSKESKPRPFRAVYFTPDRSREEIYRRIDQRVDKMVREGLENEARMVFPFRGHQALQTVGYQEFFDHFSGNCSREDAIEQIKIHTRQYAKRQLTWLRKYGDWQTFKPENPMEIVERFDQIRKSSHYG